MAESDIFPDDVGINPDWAGDEDSISRKVVREMASGKVYVRSYGTDIPVWNLTGKCTGAERLALIQFYEAKVAEGFTFRNQFVNPSEDQMVVMTTRPRFTPIGLDCFMWELTLKETTTA
jgi:hypothetical protein